MYSNSERDILIVFLGCLYFTYSYPLPDTEYPQSFFYNLELDIGSIELNRVVFQLIELASSDLLKLNSNKNFYNKQLNKLLQFTEVLNFYYDEDVTCKNFRAV